MTNIHYSKTRRSMAMMMPDLRTTDMEDLPGMMHFVADGSIVSHSSVWSFLARIIGLFVGEHTFIFTAVEESRVVDDHCSELDEEGSFLLF